MGEIIKGRVAIIGAGIAGLSVASNLHKFGWKNVKIFEGRDRIGGRVYSKPYGDKLIEIGAQWIHGEEGNVIYDIASKNDLIEEDVPCFVDVMKYSMALNFTESKHREMFLKMHDYYENIDNSKSEFESTGLSISDYVRKQLSSLKNDQDAEIMKQIFDWMYRFECHISGTSHLFHMSINDNYKHCDGNPTVEFKENYSSLLEKIKEDIPSNWIELNSNVTLIDSSQPGRIKLVMENGKTVEADHVVITLPLGVLKTKSFSLFNPSLPNDKLTAIKKIGYGTVDKIFLRFETQFWDSEYQIFNVFWKDGKNHRGFSNDEAYSDNNEYFWTNFNNSMERVPWERSIIYFTYVRHQPNLLCAWISGEGAEIMENLSEDEVLDGCYSVLRYILPDKNVPKPTEIIRSAWFRDQYSVGSYSYDSILCENPPIKNRGDLAAPIMSYDKNGKAYPGLLFAGEATHDHFFSTVHGAYETGLREALRLKDYAESVKLGCICSKSSICNVKIGIIGAGIAGLAACYKLKEMGFENVTVFEGSDRIGGRIKTVSYGEGVLEIGAQWVHGEEGNLVYEFAQKNNLLSDPCKDYSVEGKGHFMTNKFGAIDESLVDEVIIALDNISENVVSYYHNLEEVKGISLGKKFREMFLDYLNSCLNDSDEVKLIKEGIYNWYCRFLIIDNCCNSLDDLSIAGTNQWIDCPGVPLINFNRGFSTLVECLANEIGFVKSNLVLNKGVSCVEWSGSSGNVQLSFEDGSKEAFDHVIVTSSIGFLKENLNSFFNPALPKTKEKIIRSIGYGTVNKLYLIFNEPFWDTRDLGFQLVWLPNETQFEFPSWVYGISGFDIVRGQPNVLVGWIGGEQAREIELVDDEEVINVCTSLLRVFNGRNDIQKPVSLVRSKWYSDPYIRGSYCHRLLGFEFFDNPIEELCQPLYIKKSCHCKNMLCQEIQFPIVFFAGEATDKHYFSSVHGAMESGYREAKKILNLYIKSQ